MKQRYFLRGLRWPLQLLAVSLLTLSAARAQVGVGIGTASPNAAAALDVTSTTQGLLPPRLTLAERDAMTTAQSLGAAHTGLLIFNTSAGVLNMWNGTAWVAPFVGTASPGTTFAYTGAPQIYTVPAGITRLTVAAVGAAGGRHADNTAPFAPGARVQATIAVTPGEVLTIVVGGQGTGGAGVNPGGYNGGGTGNGAAGGGGGATELRRAPANGATGDYLASRNALVVAGGGGGSDGAFVATSGAGGGAGGTPTAGSGQVTGGSQPGTGATQAAPGGGVAGVDNVGGNGINAAGGGGGYYGGGGGVASNGGAGGGGGSSWATATATGLSYQVAATIGNGALTLTPALADQGPFDAGALSNLPVAAQLWQQNGTNLYPLDPTANVGLGTASPAEKFDVTGNIRLTGLLRINTGDADKILLTNQGAAGSKIGHAAGWGLLSYAGPGTGTTGYHSWLTSTTTGYAERMRLNAAGFLGLGTAAPGGRLHLVNDGGGAGSADDYLIDEYGTGDQGIYLRRANGTAAVPLDLASGDHIGRLSFVPQYAGGLGYTSGSIIQSNYRGNGATNLTDLQLWTSAAERLRISETGNVGIGTTTPRAKLDIVGGADSGGGSDPGALAFQWHGGGFRHWVRTRHNSGLGGGGNAFDFYVNNSNATDGSSNATTGTLHVLTLDNYGTPRVGIGVTNPYSMLANTSDNIIGSDGNGGNPGSLTWNATQQGYAAMIYNGGTGIVGNGLAVKIDGTGALATAFDVSRGAQTGIGAPLLTVRGSGNVGIGTNTPAHKLEVAGNIGATGPLGVILNAQDRPLITRAWDAFASGTYAGIGRWGLFMEPNALTFGVPALGNGQFQWATYADNSTVAKTLMFLNQPGWLGLGTAAPVGKLHVVTDASAGNGEDDYVFDDYGTLSNGVFLRGSRGTVAAPAVLQNGDQMGSVVFAPRYGAGTGGLGYAGSGLYGFYQGDGSNLLTDLRLHTSNAERLRIDEQGRVSIGGVQTTFRTGIYAGATTENGIYVQLNGASAAQSMKLEHNGSNFIVRPLAASSTSTVVENTASGALVINPAGGSVGIGTTSPDARLDVEAGSGNLALKVTTGTAAMSTASRAAGAGTLTVTAVIHKLTDNGTNAANGTLTISSTGAVDGQTLIVANLDAQNQNVAGVTTITLPPFRAARFVFVSGAGWLAEF